MQIIQKQRIFFAPLREIYSGKISSCVLNKEGGKEVTLYFHSLFVLKNKPLRKRETWG